MRFSLRRLLQIIAIVAVICAIIAWARNLYYVQVHTVDSVLAEYPEINQVWISTNDDTELEVEQLFFSTFEESELILEINGIDGASASEIRSRIDRALREKRPVTRPVYATLHLSRTAP